MLFTESINYYNHVASAIDEWVGVEEWLKDDDRGEPQKLGKILSQ